MAHFAKLNENNIVTEVVVVNNDILLEVDETESENKGKTFLNLVFGTSNWVKTSYNGNFRKQFAGVGYTYDSNNNVFISPKPFESWTLDENFDWQPPVNIPSDFDGINYLWNEKNQNWENINE
tara:strand:- start:104 stop:472 length:369 start_codon:yes stop_codon:yes gene_type:complete